MYDILTNAENSAILKKAFEWQGFNGKILVEKLIGKADLIKQDIERLKELEITFSVKGDKNGKF